MFTCYKLNGITRYPTTIVPDLSAGFDAPQATIQMLGPSDSPTVTVTATGPNTAKKFQFDFQLPKGDTGQPGIAPTIDPVTKHWMLGDTDTGIKAQGTVNGSSLQVTQLNGLSLLLQGNNVPVGMLTNKGNYYPVQKNTLTIDSVANTMTLQMAEYILADGESSFTPPWTIFFAAGDEGLSAYQVWLQAGHQGDQQAFFEYLRGQTYRYAFTAEDLKNGILSLSTYGFPVSVSDHNNVTYPLQHGSYVVTGSAVSVDMRIQCAAIGTSVTDTWYLNVAGGNTKFAGETDSVVIAGHSTIISTVDAQIATLNGDLCPVMLVTNLNSVYPIEKDTLSYNGGTFTLDVTRYLAYDNTSTFTAPWIVYFAGGTQGPQGQKGEQGEQGPAGVDGKDGADGADGVSSIQFAVAQADADTVTQTVQVKVVTVADDGTATYTGETVTARYGFTLED